MVTSPHILELTAPPDRVSVQSCRLPDYPADYLAWQIVGATADDVQREISRVHDYCDLRVGEAHFRNPVFQRGGEHAGRWVSRGFTRLAELEVA